MAEPINTTSGAVTALFKYYHNHRDRFYPIASATDEYPDEVYAVTLNSAVTTSQTIVRMIQSSGGTWKTKSLLNPVYTADTVLAITGTSVGTFARSNNKVYYSNYDAPVRQIRPRSSAGDTRGVYCYEAGLPDPNAKRNIDLCDETAGWTFSAGTGGGAAQPEYSPLKRTEGRACLVFSQTTAGKTSTMTFTGDALDLTSFSDGTVAAASDYIAFDVFRYDKKAISQLWIDLSNTSGFTQYYTCPITTTPSNTVYGLVTQTNQETWDNYHFDQTTHQALWGMNPYDNQLFPTRIQKAWFAQCGSITWTAITSVRFRLVGNSNASADNPAQVGIDNIRLLKNPGFGTPFRIQVAECEEQESGSTTGWESNEGASTKATFDKHLARHGVSALIVPEAAGAGETAAVTLRFGSGRNLAVFPDGQTATTSDLLRLNISWQGYKSNAYWADWTSVFTAPKIRFYNNANYRSVRVFALQTMKGGGVTKQVRFNTSHDDSGSITAPWSGDGTMDWTNVTKIAIYAPYNSTLTTPSYVIDDIRIERPKAMQAVNIFEPVDLYAIDAVSDLLASTYKEYAWVVELGTAAFKGLFGLMKYQTYGMGHATYPDYEHSSFGIAGLTLRAYGSKPFGMLLQHDPLDLTVKCDLTNYKIMTLQYPPVWDFDTNWGFLKQESIPAGPNDRFEIFVASPKPSKIKTLRIKLHGNDGSNNADKENYWYYELTGQELGWGIKEQHDKAKKNYEWNKKYGEHLDTLSKQDLSVKMKVWSDPAYADMTRDYIRDTIKIKGLDRGGWYSGTFSWKRKDMILSKDSGNNRVPDLSDCRGISIEVSGEGDGCELCVDNFVMKKEGSLNGTYYYKTVLEDEDGYLSPSTEPSLPVTCEKEDVVLNNIYVPTDQDKNRVHNKRIYRIGGDSAEWLHCGDVAVNKTQFFDNVIEENLGLALPPEAYAPPRAKVMKNIGNNMYYGNIVNRLGEVQPYRVMVSEAFAPFRVQDFDSMDIPEKNKAGGITGIEEYYGTVYIWTNDSLWTTTMGLKDRPIHRSEKGCLAKRSVTKTDYGVVWLSREGLMIGDQSRVDDKFFEPINGIFDSYKESELENAIGIYNDRYFYLFYDSSLRKGICCYMPDRLFSELAGSSDSEGPFDVRSVSKWDGADDYNDIYYGRSDGTIFKMFSGDDDNGTAITTTLKTMSFGFPSHHIDKQYRASYVTTKKLGTADVTLTPKVYANELLSETLAIVTATLTTAKTYVTKGGQGNYGQHIAYELAGTNRHMISQITMKVTPEEDTEYLP